LEPLLSRLHEDRRHTVVPSIDGINHETFQHEGASGLGIVGFTWTLGQDAQGSGDASTKPKKSPIMAGGLFAVDRAFFLHLGGYDQGMRFYGGEEMEIGFRTWQCGGDIEFLPCSHVFHVFRVADYWHGENSGTVAYKVPGLDITRNKLRTAAVWMDDYAKLVEYASPPLPKDEGWSLGDLEARRQLREKLQCKSFQWFLENAAPAMYVPKISGLRAGCLVSKDIQNACVDTLGGNDPGLYPCHWQHGTQGLVLDGVGLVRIPTLLYTTCLGAAADGRHVTLQACPMHNPAVDFGGRFSWVLDEITGQMRSKSGVCLEALRASTPKSPYDLRAAPCAKGAGLGFRQQQVWRWQSW